MGPGHTRENLDILKASALSIDDMEQKILEIFPDKGDEGFAQIYKGFDDNPYDAQFIGTTDEGMRCYVTMIEGDPNIRSAKFHIELRPQQL